MQKVATLVSSLGKTLNARTATLLRDDFICSTQGPISIVKRFFTADTGESSQPLAKKAWTGEPVNPG